MEARYLTDLEWRICHAVNIYVFRNGRDGEQPILVHIPPAKKKNMKTVMGVIQDRVKYPVGYAKYLFKMDGTRVKDPCELEMYNNYVVASNFEKHFKCAAYGRRRSPLLVLNRESKHVRVLKLQNQNYYEWLLKKKAVGEERPPYIYPPYYTNENKLPQDLPMGKMGNYNPGEVHAPGCCYPSTDGGRTYRIGTDQKYVVNTVTVDVAPDFRKLPLPDFKDKRKSKYGPNGRTVPGTYGSKHGKMLEPTPSDMLNANVLASDVASHEAVSITPTSESDDQGRMHRKSMHHHQHRLHHKQHDHNHNHHHKTKVQRVHVVSSEEYHHHNQRQCHARAVVNVTESSTVSTQSSQEIVKKQMQNQAHHHHHHHHQRETSQKKHSNSKHRHTKVKVRETEQHQQSVPSQYMELGVPPPPPAQFRDTTADLNNNKNCADTMGLLPPPTQFKTETQNILSYVDRAINEQNGNVPVAPQKSFYYSPEKLAEINSAGNIQPLDLTFATNAHPPHNLQQQASVSPSPHPAATQWAILHHQPQGQQQLVQQVYAIESQPGGPGTPTTTTLIPAQSIDPSGVLGPYAMTGSPGQHQNHVSPPQLLQNLTVPQGSIPQPAGMLQSLSSQQALFQNGANQSPATQCIVIPNNCMSPQPPPGTQLIALPSNSSQNHLQQVYQLGIIQQPNPQTCMQVDAKAMRQYVDNQKLIECRFQQQQQQQQLSGAPEEEKCTNKGVSRRKQQQHRHRRNSDITDITESEVDIPFTPLKTYRLDNPPDMAQSHSSIGQNERSQNPSRYRNERLPTKVKSRNVAIQMGYPASARSSRAVNDYLECIRNSNIAGRLGGGGELSRASDVSFILNNVNNRSRSDSMANAVNLGPSFSSFMRTPRTDRERFFASSTGSGCRVLRRSGNFCSSYSDQYLGLHSGRNLANHSLFSSQSPPNNTNPSSNHFSEQRPARRRLSTDPVLEELITIPPPTEFRGYPLHTTRHTHDHQLDNCNARSSDNVKKLCNNNNPSEHSMYPYTNNDRSQYMYSRYP